MRENYVLDLLRGTLKLHVTPQMSFLFKQVLPIPSCVVQIVF